VGTPQLTADQVAQVSGVVAEYISSQRQTFFPHSAAPSAEQRAAMEGFFSPHLLDTVRLLMLNVNRVQNPPFYPILARMGFANLPDFSQMAAITFRDVVVSHGRFTNGLLFHELVHVEQYRQLGVPRFAEFYVRGFLSGGGYNGIPLEVNAYTLGARFEADPHQRFSVSKEVESWARQGRF